MADYTIQVPEVTGAAVTPNPVYQNTAVTIRITITEKTVTLEPYSYSSGELYSGEV